MSRLYARLTKLQQDLTKAVTEEERETIEDEIYLLTEEINEEESAKYDVDDDE